MTEYIATPLVNGFPAQSSSHGAFGWSSLWLLSNRSRRVLIDTGPPQYIPLIRTRLAAMDLTPFDITDVLLTHLHWDHIANFTMFPNAQLWVGDRELDWAARQPAGSVHLSDLHVQEILRRSCDVGRIRADHDVLPGIHVIDTAGHTPGHLAFLTQTAEGAFTFAGDAVKNLRELVTGVADSTMDPRASRRSIDRLRSLLRGEGDLLVPGHDAGLAFDGQQVTRIDSAQARVTYILDQGSSDQERTIP
ncbi:N-acyl homoserine lactonase family protein [Microlunatus sp. GCM10028923]|uniref:N-acyl homoserine lactonase family protein n=1 Tax=Microlunatus sp. GCM10028923 TaxID=3273400 RepID=UPI0036205DE1